MEEKKKKAKGGGAAPLRKAATLETKIIILREQRQKRKYNTIVRGLETIPDVKIKDVAKVFGRKFSSGASVQDTPQFGKEVSIQGDVFFDIPNVLISEYKVCLSSSMFLRVCTSSLLFVCLFVVCHRCHPQQSSFSRMVVIFVPLLNCLF